MPLGSPNLDPVLDKKYYFPHLFSGLASKLHARFQTWPRRNYVIITLIDYTEANKKRFLKIHFEFAYFSFSLIHLELKRQIRSYVHSRSFLENHAPAIPGQNGRSLYLSSDQNGAKTLPMVAKGQEMVRERSGNFTSSQGKFKSLKEVREK